MSHHLFPFEQVSKDSRIVLYGAGNVGKAYLAQIVETCFCEVILWVDKNADGTLTKKPETIVELDNSDYDTVVVAVENKSVASEITLYLVGLGIPKSKILHKIHKPLYPGWIWKNISAKDICVEQIGWNKKTCTGYKNIDFTDIEFYEENILLDIENHLIGKIDGTDYSKCEMSYKDRAFLNGIIRKTKPKTIVEIGLAAGGSSCVILNAIRDLDGAKLYSFDYNTIWYNCGREDGKKTGFLVEKIVPELALKWELYTGGVPCKYFDKIPSEGVDICFIDTVHSNPGEHLNILEILPFMKKNGIVVFHDTVYHCLRYSTGSTCHVAINTLNGKRILLNSEQTMGLPNISAIVLDDNVDDMLYPLFANISLPWQYKIRDDDFNEMFKHFSKYYPRDLVRLYVYYCHFYMNDGLRNKDIAIQIAEGATK